MSASDRYPAFDPSRFEEYRALRRLRWGHPLHYLETTTSTNDDAKAAARAGAREGAVFLAEYQTQGRGRRARAWLSSSRTGLLFSLVLRPGSTGGQVAALPLVVGLSVARAVEECAGESPKLKWPNDVLMRGRKVAGILVESQLHGNRIQAIVVGVGINVAQTEFAPELATLATSLNSEARRDLSRELLLATVLEKLEVLVETHARSGLAALLPELRAADALRGEWLEVEGVRGVGAGLDEEGALLVESRGTLHRVISGTVTRLKGPPRD